MPDNSGRAHTSGRLHFTGGAANVPPAMTQPQSPTYKSTFAVPKMDCPSEEHMIRMALDAWDGVQSLSFDFGARRVTAVHRASAEQVLQRLRPLGLGAELIQSGQAAGAADDDEVPAHDDAAEARLVRLLLAINAAMFCMELAVGLWAQSTGLIADSLDMFADAAVYGMALFAVGRAAAMKRKAAHFAGWLQLALALGALAEVVRRFVQGSEPDSNLMMGMGLAALAANVTCLVLVAGQKNAGAHMKASLIFSANDVIANAGVIAAGALVAATGSRYPDLVIGTLVAVVVLGGARRILALK